MISWVLVVLICAVGVLLALVAGVVAAALPDATATPHWSDRCRRGCKAFLASMTLYVALVLMALGVLTAL